MSIAALVLGIISLFFGKLIGTICGILAIIFAAISLKKTIGIKGLAVAGLICGIVGTAFNIIFMIICWLSGLPVFF